MSPLLPTLVLAAGLPLTPTLQQVLDGGPFVDTPAGFRIIALSHLADGCAARVDDDAFAARSCVVQALERARALQPPRLNLDDGREGLWLTHLALILGAAHRTGPCLDEALHRRVVTGLATRSAEDPTGHTSSFANRRERWPADQAATLASIARFDAAHATHLVDPPLAKYRAHIMTIVDVTTGLPWSEARGVGTGRLPRGSAVTYSVRYLAEVDPPLAARWWEALKAHHLVERVITGFREWPPGREHPADVDSGPIVQGVGASATGFGIAAARAMGDEAMARRLEHTAGIVGTAARQLGGDPAKVAGSTLADAIRFQGGRPMVRSAPAAAPPPTAVPDRP